MLSGVPCGTAAGAGSRSAPHGGVSEEAAVTPHVPFIAVEFLELLTENANSQKHSGRIHCTCSER